MKGRWEIVEGKKGCNDREVREGRKLRKKKKEKKNTKEEMKQVSKELIFYIFVLTFFFRKNKKKRLKAERQKVGKKGRGNEEMQ